MRKKKLVSSKKDSRWLFLILLFALPFTILLAQSSQELRSSAQTILSTPPMFFCIATGESNKELCASSSLDSKTTFQLNGYPLERTKIVYYNDTLTGEASYTNTGDKAVTIKKIALVAEAENGKSRLEFNPNKQNIVVQPGKTVSIPTAARMFESPNPSGTWEVFSSVTMESGQRFDNPRKTIINVSAACTGLRAIPLVESDLTILQAYCAQNSQSKLCTSRQYCELTGGEKCEQKAPNQPHLDKHLQCDENIIIPEEEQGFLEEFCEANPNAATCKEFCERTIDSSLCPDGFTIDENVEVQAAASRSQAVAGISTVAAIGNTNCRPGQQTNKNTGECCKYQGPNLPSGQCPRAPGAPSAPGSPTAPSVSKCGAAGGTCKSRNTCSGRVLVGLCPGGIDNICCTAPGQPEAMQKCASGTRNHIGQCCRYNGALSPTGKCPRTPGGTVEPARRIETSSGPVRRSCATGRVFRNGRCQRVDGSTPNTPLPTCKGAGAACSSGQCCGTLVCNLTRPGSGFCGRQPAKPVIPGRKKACVARNNNCTTNAECCSNSCNSVRKCN